MLCCNTSGTKKMDMLVMGSAKRPQCFSKNWDPSRVNIIYKYNKTAWRDENKFSIFAHVLDRLQTRKYKQSSEKKAWLLLDNTSTHHHALACVAR
jgi:hypothetical protein